MKTVDVQLMAIATVEALLRAGVREFCLCAGSRNSPLIRQLVAQPDVRLWRFFEERDAAFFALGRCRAILRPVAVLTTSGTAAAELLPAMVEAHYQGLPLLAVTADRPRSYRFSGAPQAINQYRLFGDYARSFVDAAAPAEILAAPALLTAMNPAHWNICLEEPVDSPPPQPIVTPCIDNFASNPTRPGHSSETLLADIILLGDLLPPERVMTQEILSRLPSLPIWAEAASGLRPWLEQSHHHMIHGGDAALRSYCGQNVVRIGGVPSCRLWRDLETRLEVNVASVSRTEHPGLARKSRHFPMTSLLDGTLLLEGMPNNSFQKLVKEATALAASFPGSEPQLLQALAKQIPATAGLFLGNSLTIRTWNLAVPPHAAEENLCVLRGANGIDGNLSYALGALAAFPEAWVVVGELTALYNLAAPWVMEQLQQQSIRLVVMNNHGGMLFRRLPSLRQASEVERVFIENPPPAAFTDLSGWAKLWGLHYSNVDSRETIAALALPNRPCLIEIMPDNAASEAFWQAWSHS